MCSKSNLNDLLLQSPSDGNTASSSVSGGGGVQQIAAVAIQKAKDKYFIIDVREPDELVSASSNEEEEDGGDIVDNKKEGIADANIPLGKLLAHRRDLNELLDDVQKTKKIALLCNTGYRATIAAAELAQYKNNNNLDLAVVRRGMLGWNNPAATVPDLLVVLGTKSSPEKITLALSAAAAAASTETVVLALLGDGICTFLRKGSNKRADITAGNESSLFQVEETYIGEPFQPCEVILQKVLLANTVILACKSCVQNRGLEFGSDLLDIVQPMQMPDLLRMLGEAKKTLQFM